MKFLVPPNLGVRLSNFMNMKKVSNPIYPKRMLFKTLTFVIILSKKIPKDNLLGGSGMVTTSRLIHILFVSIMLSI